MMNERVVGGKDHICTDSEGEAEDQDWDEESFVIVLEGTISDGVIYLVSTLLEIHLEFI